MEEYLSQDVHVHKRNNSMHKFNEDDGNLPEKDALLTDDERIKVAQDRVSRAIQHASVVSPSVTIAPLVLKTDADKDTQCGLFCFYPKILQCFAAPIPFLISLCGVVVAQSLVVSGLLSSINTTIEKRYNMSSIQVGYIYSCYEISCIIATFLISYFGHKQNRARLLGFVTLFLSVGYVMLALPQFLSSNYKISVNGTDSLCMAHPDTSAQLTDSRLENTLSISAKCDRKHKEVETWALLLFCTAQLVIGIGASPIYVLGLTYLWDNVSSRQYPIYSALMYVSGAIGPALGFFFGAWFLSIYIDYPWTSAPAGMNTSDPQWLGAWWIGLIVSAVLSFAASLPLTCYPKRLKSGEQNRSPGGRDSAGQYNSSVITNHHENKTSPKSDFPGSQENSCEAFLQRLSPNIGHLKLDEVIHEKKGHARTRSLNHNIGHTRTGSWTPHVRHIRSGSLTINGFHFEVAALSSQLATPKLKLGSYKDCSNESGHQSESEEKSNLKYGKLKELPQGVKRLVTNPVWLSITMMTVVEQSVITAFSTYVSKYLQAMFNESAHLASIHTGAVIIPSAITGVLLGGFLMRQFQISISGAAKLMVLLCFLTTITTLSLMFLGCDSIRFVGVNTHYPRDGPISVDQPSNLTSRCNINCGCSGQLYQPVCSVNGKRTYFSPCFAGCLKTNPASQHIDAQTYLNCSCENGKEVTEGKCFRHCRLMVPSLTLIFIQVFLTAIGQAPTNIITLSSVSSTDSSFALGMQIFLVRCLAFIPVPIYFGQIFDSTCLKRLDSCEGQGACLEYDRSRLPYYWLGTVFSLKMLGIVWASLTWFAARNRLSGNLPMSNIQQDSPGRLSQSQHSQWHDSCQSRRNSKSTVVKRASYCGDNSAISGTNNAKQQTLLSSEKGVDSPIDIDKDKCCSYHLAPLNKDPTTSTSNVTLTTRADSTNSGHSSMTQDYCVGGYSYTSIDSADFECHEV